MTRRTLRPFLRVIAMAVLGVGFTMVLASPAGAAGSGYTIQLPPPPTPAPTPVVTPTGCPTGTPVVSQAVGSTGGTVSAPVGGSNVSVNVPAGAFPNGVEVVITLGPAPAVVPVGDALVLQFGVNFCVNGVKYQGTISPPVTVTVSNPAIHAGQTLFLQEGSTLVPAQATISNGSLVVTVTSDPDFVLVAASTGATVIPGATSVVTGKPFLGEGLIAGGLVLLGSMLLFFRLRFRHR
jgi:hypothetical protein